MRVEPRRARSVELSQDDGAPSAPTRCSAANDGGAGAVSACRTYHCPHAGFERIEPPSQRSPLRRLPCESAVP